MATKKTYDIGVFHNQLTQHLDHLEQSTDFPSHFYNAFFEGEREIYQKEFTQIKQFDEKWIRTIESYFPSIDTITKRLKSTLRYDEEILPIEKTKKVGPRSIRHLSSHSELIREIDEEDDPVPFKVLSNQSEVEYGIYENRFVMTLITRLQSFVGDRLKIIKNEIDGIRDTHLTYDSTFKFDDMDYEMHIEVKQKEVLNKRKINEHNISVYERVEKLYKLITRLNTSDFMRMMKKYKPVTSPIMKTQIILKNADFKNAYLLWLYLDKYYILDYQLDTKTVNKRFSSIYSKQIDQIMLNIFSTFFQHAHQDKDGLSEGKVKYRSKKAIQLTKKPDEIEIIPLAYEVEPQIANEYFLEQNKKLFASIYDETIKQNPKYTLGLKNALTKTMSITNDLYASFFKIDQDHDVFQRLVQEEDPFEELEEAIKKQKISRIIREVKEKDYKEAIKLEQKWHQVVHDKQKNILYNDKKELNNKIKDKISYIEKTFDESKHQDEKAYLKKKDIIVRKNKETLTQLRKKLEAQFKIEKNKLKEKEKLRLEKEQEAIKRKAEKAIAKQRQKYEKDIEKLKKELKLKKEKLKENIKNKEKNMVIKSNKQLEKQRKNDLLKANNTIEKEKQRLVELRDKLENEVEAIDEKLKELKVNDKAL